MKKFSYWFLLLNFLLFSATAQSISFRSGNLLFSWNPTNDSGILKNSYSESTVWSGSLLPSWWLQLNGKRLFIKASSKSVSLTGKNEWAIQLAIGNLGKGELQVVLANEVLRFERLLVSWNSPLPPAIISMYYGSTSVNPAGNAVSALWDKPFVPDWQSMGFCVPGAKEGPAQSYFRNWDFGQSVIALGSFGPSMGSLYAAAFPRPAYFIGMGNNEGFISLGAGNIPDAAMSLRILGTRGCFEYIYNEDLWGGPKNNIRIWQDPLRISISENAWDAFSKYENSFLQKSSVKTAAIKPFWNTWGTWARGVFIIDPITAMAKQLNAGMVVIDDPWEESMGGASPDLKKFPDLPAALDTARAVKMEIGFWQSVGWIDDPYSVGLTNEDLLLNKQGKPAKANWNFDPLSKSHFCLDPSSAKARAFIIRRTEQLMNTYHPKLLKLDFGYGLPSPAMAVPRNPDFRGEKYAYELVKLIHDAAKRIDPEVTILYYSINPLWTNIEDLVSLDDQGDLWYAIKEGHASWSIWAALVGNRNTAISGASGYDWEKDDESVLNSCILGVPGAVLTADEKGNHSIDVKWLNRRLAINYWYRRTTNWKPLWLNSFTGDFTKPPELNSWGRLEQKEADWILTALVLRDENKNQIIDKKIQGIAWTGRWALLSQDDMDIFSSARLAIIPFDAGRITIPMVRKPKQITRKNLQGDQLFSGWSWNENGLSIQVRAEELKSTAGFLIE